MQNACEKGTKATYGKVGSRMDNEGQLQSSGSHDEQQRQAGICGVNKPQDNKLGSAELMTRG